MIVGTAGHIDHGKTTLVQALTGVNTDRLPEEKKRGISIELGYAFMEGGPDGERIGFVDVPGHERLVHTMLAGATGMDLALLLVAADDGVMPQTLEHLAVLSLLGIARGAVVLTKCDRVDPQRVPVLAAQIQALLEGTSLEGAPVLAVSAHTGQGLAELRQWLLSAAATTGARASAAHAFRLAVDRAFTLDGTGTVATGTVHAGQVQVGDELCLTPGTQRVRVRSIHAQNRSETSAHAGQRCALALSGVPRDEVARGQWLVHPDLALSSTRLDTRITLWRGEAKPLRSGTSVHVHIGAASAMGSVAVLEPDTSSLAPGQSALVQLVLHTPMAAWHGDRVVLRDASASRTIAGGTVLDPLAPARYRRRPERLAELAAMGLPTLEQRLQACLLAAPQGVDVAQFCRAQAQALNTPLDAALQQVSAQAHWAMAAAHAQAGAQRLLATLADFHAKHAQELGPDPARLRRLALPRWPEALWLALLGQLREQGQLEQKGACLFLPEHGQALSITEVRIAQKIATALGACGFDGAWVRDLAQSAGEPEALVRVTLARLAQRGELHQVVKDLYYPEATMAHGAAKVRAIAAAHDSQVLAAQFRDATGLGRKRAIQLLEYFDRIGLLRRVGDLHKLRADSTLWAPQA